MYNACKDNMTTNYQVDRLFHLPSVLSFSFGARSKFPSQRGPGFRIVDGSNILKHLFERISSQDAASPTPHKLSQVPPKVTFPEAVKGTKSQY